MSAAVKKGRTYPALDNFRLMAALLVTAVHTSPLAPWSEAADFWLTRVLARVAVPFFLMVSGYFLQKGGWEKERTGRFLKKTGLLYLGSVLLYLPLNLYAGLPSLGEGVRKLLFEGTFYHLWYLPAAMLGCVIAWRLSRMGLRAALPAAAALYLIGLGGDSYYGIVSALPPLKAAYEAIFLVLGYTRNGLFMAPLFLLLGAASARIRIPERAAAAGFLLSLAAMSGEGFLLRHMGVQRHDSMYLLLPVCMEFLFSLLLGRNQGENKAARSVSMLVYLLHPWTIVLVRGGAKLAGLEKLFIQNQGVHFLAVAALTFAGSGMLVHLSSRALLRPAPAARAWREIDLKALAHNVRVLKEQAGPGCELMAVLKADAYGHGARETARALQRQGIVKAYAAACLTEAIQLRRAGIRGTILVLGYTPPEQAELLRRWHLTQTVVSGEYAARLSAGARGSKITVHIAVDTGMHRLGIPSGDMEAIRRVFRLPNLNIQGMFSHLCVSDSLAPDDVSFTLSQVKRFYDTVLKLQEEGLDTGKIHLQASYGLLNLPAQPCDYARVGIALYGVYSHNGPVQRGLDIWPVLSLRARVALVRKLEPGETAGYGCAFRTERSTRLAVICVGYADGLPRDFGARGGEVLLRGQRAPVVGMLCMDQMLADVTDIGDVKEGDIATVLGRDGAGLIRAEDLAEQCGTITNEFLAGLGARLDFRYKK